MRKPILNSNLEKPLSRPKADTPITLKYLKILNEEELKTYIDHTTSSCVCLDIFYQAVEQNDKELVKTILKIPY